MHFPRHNPTTCLLPQRRSEARQVSKPRFAFLGLGAEGWPNRHLLFCAKSPNSRPDTRETTIQTAPWKYYIWSESPGSELWWEQIQRHRSFAQTGLTQWTNCVIQRKFCHCWQAVMLFIQFNRAISHLKPVPMLKGFQNEHRSRTLEQACLQTDLIGHMCLWRKRTAVKIQLLCSVDFINKSILTNIQAGNPEFDKQICPSE